ncbi:MAG: hypothetical protein AB8G15_06080 [Saprospiraceae bacterium]
MPNIKYYFSLLILTCLFTACKEETTQHELDFNVQRSNIVGTWYAKRTTKEIRADTVHLSFDTPTEVCFTFNADGKGSRKFSNLDISFEWYYQYDPPRVIIADDNVAMFSLRNTTVYKVKTNEIDQQVWEYDVVDSLGLADYFRHTLSFQKK